MGFTFALLFLSITLQFPHTCLTTQNKANKSGHRLMKEGKQMPGKTLGKNQER